MSSSWMRRVVGAAIACVIAAPVSGNAQTTVRGRVTDAATGLPVVGALVQIESTGFLGTVYADVIVDADGAYAWTGTCELAEPTSQCVAEAFANGYIDSVSEFDPAATDVELDFAMNLVPVVSITGTVRAAVSGAPMSNVNVTFEYLDGSEWVYDDAVRTSDDGTFAFLDLPGTYRVCAGGMEWGTLAQCFDHFDHGAFFGEEEQTPITLANGGTHANTDFDLVAGGAVSGTLHDAYAGLPLANARAALDIYDADGSLLDGTTFTTDALGHYRVTGLPDGTFYVGLDADSVFVDHRQLYPDIVCDDSGCPPATSGDAIEIVAGNEASAIDFTLRPDVVIGGRVTDARDGASIASARVDIYRWTSFLGYTRVAHASTDALGNYSLYVRADDYYPTAQAAAPFIGVTYPDVPCLVNACIGDGNAQTFGSGDRITHLDFALAHGAAVAGHVADATTGLPLAASVALYDASYNKVWQGETDDAGNYETPGWMPGTFYVEAASFSILACDFYEGRPCPPDGDPATAGATPIAVGVDEVRDRIDFNLLGERIFATGFEPD